MKSSEITPPEVYFNRRKFLKTGVVAAAAVATGVVYRSLNGLPAVTREEAAIEGLATGPTTAPSSGEALDPAIVRAFHTDEVKTPYQSVTNYNNFYEFSTDKEGVAGAVGNFST